VLVDAGAGTVEYANAGHTIPYHLKADGSLGVLKGACPLLGDEATASYRSTEITVTPGDGLVFYTDGLIKANNGAGDPYGERRLQKLLKGASGNAALVRTQILGSIDEHRGSLPYRDDAALLVVRVG
jgi:sigma-B regulation protein RsbU (phosphoserine phosphatase)